MGKSIKRPVKKTGNKIKAIKSKKKAPKKSKRVLVPKTRNNQTMTESAFWGWMRSRFRKMSLGWKPISQCKANSRRAYNGPNKRQRYEYRCNECGKYHKGDAINVDHIEPAGSLRSSNDLKDFVEGLFCEIHGLQVLCNPCHDIKTEADKAAMKLKREKNEQRKKS